MEDLVQPVISAPLSGELDHTITFARRRHRHRHNGDARTAWDEFPPSARKAMLWWVISAVKDETRAQRIETIVTKAARGERAQG